jgi:hypothetical protein
MITYKQGFITPFWGDEFKTLNYHKEFFTPDNPDLTRWREVGYNQDIANFSGLMCPHGNPHPEWIKDILEWVKNEIGLKDIGVCFYNMITGTILPLHSDHYSVYKTKFNCKLDQINRILIFLEDWKSGHYFEIENTPIMNYKAGTFIQWKGDAKHMAANIGEEPRYTLQLTGWK